MRFKKIWFKFIYIITSSTAILRERINLLISKKREKKKNKITKNKRQNKKIKEK